jgi:GxxExxY protein
MLGQRPERILTAEEEQIATAIVDSAYQVHKKLGPGLLESIYERCLKHELEKRGFRVERQLPVPILYDGLMFDEGFRLDLLVNETVICEIKSAIENHPVFLAQTLSHLKLTNRNLGFLINFNVVRLKDGLKRVIRPLDVDEGELDNREGAKDAKEDQGKF